MLFSRPRGIFVRLVTELYFTCVFAAIGPSFASDMPARPNSLPGCDSATYEQATATGHRVVAANPSTVFTDYAGDEAAKLLAVINAFPPATKYPAEHVLVIEMDAEDWPVMIGLVHDGCIIISIKARQDTWTKMRHGALGDAL